MVKSDAKFEARAVAEFAVYGHGAPDGFQPFAHIAETVSAAASLRLAGRKAATIVFHAYLQSAIVCGNPDVDFGSLGVLENVVKRFLTARNRSCLSSAGSMRSGTCDGISSRQLILVSSKTSSA